MSASIQRRVPGRFRPGAFLAIGSLAMLLGLAVLWAYSYRVIEALRCERIGIEPSRGNPRD